MQEDLMPLGPCYFFSPKGSTASTSKSFTLRARKMAGASLPALRAPGLRFHKPTLSPERFASLGRGRTGRRVSARFPAAVSGEKMVAKPRSGFVRGVCHELMAPDLIFWPRLVFPNGSPPSTTSGLALVGQKRSAFRCDSRQDFNAGVRHS